MVQTWRSCFILVAFLLLAALGCAPAANAPRSADIHGILNEGADLYNSGDRNGCYRLYEGALRGIRLQSGHQPEIVRVINGGLAEADQEQTPAARAFALRKTLLEVSAILNRATGSHIDSDNKSEAKQEDNLGQEP